MATKTAASTAPQTPNQFRKSLIDQGLTLKEWAEAREYNPEYCSRVLTGLVKGNRGKGHDIAVAMGIKADLSVKPQSTAREVNA